MRCKLILLLTTLLLSSCEKYCFQVIDGKNATVKEIEEFVDSDQECRKPSVLSVLARAGNREGVDYLLSRGYVIERSSYSQLIRHGWWDLIPPDINWEYPDGDMTSPYSAVCGFESQDIFRKYINNVADAGIKDPRDGFTCLHFRLNEIHDQSDPDLILWRGNIEAIIEKGGDLSAETDSGKTPIDFLIQECESYVDDYEPCIKAKAITLELAEEHGVKLSPLVRKWLENGAKGGVPSARSAEQ